eukprot:g880.t1
MSPRNTNERLPNNDDDDGKGKEGEMTAVVEKHVYDVVPGEDPTVENSMSVRSCLLCFFVIMLFTDFMWGSSNRKCVTFHTKKCLSAWNEQLRVSLSVQEECKMLSGDFFEGTFVETFLLGSCSYIHPKSQISIFLHESAERHSDIATNCAVRYSTFMGIAVFVGSLFVTVANPHTRGMLPWIIRNPMGLEVN